MSEMNPLLELAARNDAEGFKQAVDEDPSAVDAVDLWYGRKIGGGPTQMGLHHRTPLMVASSYGSLDVLRIILGFSDDVGRSCGPEKTTALHCAASSGAPRVTEAVELLLAAGADPNCVDADGRRPVDVIVTPFHSNSIRLEIVHLFGGGDTSSDSSDEGGSPSSDSTISSPMAATSSKVYPVDPSLPDIKMGIYSTDEFRMYSFKVRPCSRAYSHDWTECPFAHPGENARRRDPMRYNYSCVPCPDFRKGGCRRGDACEYAHGVFECWLHPAQYRTRLCKDAAACSRRVCFFAHTPQQLRTVHIPNSSPRSSAAIEMAMMSLLPLSPSSSAMDNHFPKPQVPMIHLPVQSSRLRSSLSARDVPVVRPNNLDRVFSGEISSPRYADHVTLLSSPSHKAAVLNHYHHLLSPINTPRPSEQSFSQASSPGRMSPLAEREKMLQLRSRDLAWGKLDWGANVDELDEDRDVSWVNSLVNTTEMDEKLVGCTRRAPQREDHAVLGSWLEQMQID